MFKKVTPHGTIVKKHNMIIRKNVKVKSLLSARILALAISCLRADESEFQELYKIDLKPVMPKKRSGSWKNDIDKACEDLSESGLRLDNYENVPTRRRALTKEVYEKDGYIYVEFNSKATPFLLNLEKHFTEIPFLEYLKLPTNYTQRIFEILYSFKYKGKGTVSVEDLHDWLNTKKNMQKDFSRLRTRVLEKAQDEIHKLTSLRYKMKYIKKGNKIDKVEFTFLKSPHEIGNIKAVAVAIIDTPEYSKAFTCYSEKKDPKCLGNTSEICKVCHSHRKTFLS